MMKDIHGNPMPVVRRAGSHAKSPEPASRGIEQRHWTKIFVVGIFLSIYGSLEFLAGRPEISSIFNDPVYAAYWVFTGIVVIFAALVLRAWGSR